MNQTVTSQDPMNVICIDFWHNFTYRSDYVPIGLLTFKYKWIRFTIKINSIYTIYNIIWTFRFFSLKKQTRIGVTFMINGCLVEAGMALNHGLCSVNQRESWLLLQLDLASKAYIRCHKYKFEDCPNWETKRDKTIWRVQDKWGVGWSIMIYGCGNNVLVWCSLLVFRLSEIENMLIKCSAISKMFLL